MRRRRRVTVGDFGDLGAAFQLGVASRPGLNVVTAASDNTISSQGTAPPSCPPGWMPGPLGTTGGTVCVLDPNFCPGGWAHTSDGEIVAQHEAPQFPTYMRCLSPAEQARRAAATAALAPFDGSDPRAPDFAMALLLFFPEVIFNYQIGAGPLKSDGSHVRGTQTRYAGSPSGISITYVIPISFDFPVGAPCVTAEMVGRAANAIRSGLFDKIVPAGSPGLASILGAGLLGSKAGPAGALVGALTGFFRVFFSASAPWNIPDALQDYHNAMLGAKAAAGISLSYQEQGPATTDAIQYLQMAAQQGIRYALTISGRGQYTLLEGLRQVRCTLNPGACAAAGLPGAAPSPFAMPPPGGAAPGASLFGPGGLSPLALLALGAGALLLLEAI